MTADGPIRTLFIANRGEIAARMARTARAMGIQPVIPPTAGAWALDLLDASAVISAAVGAGADALHPGYGFLAENAAFADAVNAAGIRWVGPPGSAIRAVGDKAAARRLARSLDVPTLAGYDEADQSDAALLSAAQRLGLPVLVKPSAGGGGKGMRVVRSFESLVDALAGARREALAAFGDDRLILERFVAGPRHVEVQILFDGFGAGVSLGERDCSLQRRQQKVLEESPSPAVGSELRVRMGEAAMRLALAVGYVSAGTVEFLLDDRGSFSFLEMNTRLQVEHPVTEAVTGRDLVADQLRIAEGWPLADVLAATPPTLGPVPMDRLGAMPAAAAAIEVRLYAEDADDGFLPATGRIAALEWPAGEGIRVDSGITVGDEITGRFDPMLAKIIAAGATREEALNRLASALDATTVLGVTTNLRFLRWVLREPVVRAGEVRIDTLDRIWPPDDWADRIVVPDVLWAQAAAMLGAGGAWSGGWRSNGPARVAVVSEGIERAIEPSAAPVEAGWVAWGGTLFVDHLGQSIAFRLAEPPDVDAIRRTSGSGAVGALEARSPMPGVVLGVHVEAGAAVEPGTPLLTLEAMKMEHVVEARTAGFVERLLVAAGDPVAKGQIVAVIRA